MRQTIVAANWKMHGDISSNNSLVNDLKSQISPADGQKVIICPPCVYLQQIQQLLGETNLDLGAQNVATATSGAFTGEVSVSMLAEFACNYVIIGHSERRALFGETNASITPKLENCFAAGLTPILCVGESKAERDKGSTFEVITAQLDPMLAEFGLAKMAKAVIAYEPVWAIGTNLSAKPEDAQAVHSFIREKFKSESLQDEVSIIYGGSVKAANASALIEQADVDGFLVGGASLQAAEFIQICHNAGI